MWHPLYTLLAKAIFERVGGSMLRIDTTEPVANDGRI